MCTCIILIVNLPAEHSEQEGMDQFMREMKINKWNNISMQFIIEFILMKVQNMTIQARHILLNSEHAIVDPTQVVCYHAHCCIAYMDCLLITVVL